MIKKEHPVRKTPLSQSQAPQTSTQPSQFNATPRFTFSSTPRPTATQDPPRSTPFANRYLTPAKTVPKQRDVIESFSEEDLYDVPHKSIEDGDDIELDFEHGDEDDDFNLLEEPSPKRRRLPSSPLLDQDDDLPPAVYDTKEDETGEDLLSSSLPIVSSPPAAPRHKVPSTTPRFLISSQLPSSTALPPPQNQTPFLKPPRFRPPDPEEGTQGLSDPLPEQFSPHRRGQKYVVGGLAAEVRDWLVSLESDMPTRIEKDEIWRVKIMVDEITGGSKAGMTLVKGRHVRVEEGEMADPLLEMRLILAGEGAGTGLQRGSKIEVGNIVGIKGPVWEVVSEGESWGVGVDWKVLS